MMSTITIAWPAELNEHGRPMLWFGSWLKGDDGAEGEWFYSGHGGLNDAYPVPAWATGLRVRRWPNEGFDAEYCDLLNLGEQCEIAAGSLDFEAPQRFSRLRAS